MRDWQPFSRSGSPAFREYVRGHDPKAAFPHRATCIKILRVLHALTEQKTEVLICKHKQKYPEPCAGATSDIWSTTSCRSSFFCMRLNMVLDPDEVAAAGPAGMLRPIALTECAPMIAFREFAESKHSGKIIAAVKKCALAKFNLDAKRSLSLMTEDGASNNKCSAKILEAAFMVCCPHNLQRAVLFAAGEAGSTSKNPELKAFIQRASKMAASPHRSTKTSSLLEKAQLDAGTTKSRVLVTETANVTRWTGLFRMAHKNRLLEKPLSLALTGSAQGVVLDDGPIVDPLSDDDTDSSDDEEALQLALRGPHSVSLDNDESIVTANELAGKEFPLAHRLLDARGFLDNALLESVLHQPHQVCLLLQKDEGMGLSLAWQMMRGLHSVATSDRVSVVSGDTKEGDWRDIHVANLPEKYRIFRRVLAEELESRFHTSTTPDDATLLALAFDASVDKSADTGIFVGKGAAQELMEGTHRRTLLRRQQRMPEAAGGSAPAPAPPAPAPAPAPALAPATAPAPAPPNTPAPTGVKRLAPNMLLMLQPAGKAAKGGTTSAMKRVDEEITRFTSIAEGVVAQGFHSRFFRQGIFDQKGFFYEHRHEIPLHYNAFVAEVGSAKAASSNVETVFSGVGGMLQKATTLGGDVVESYTICHYQWLYEFLCPSDDEVAAAYMKLHGNEAHESDAEEEEDEQLPPSPAPSEH